MRTKFNKAISKARKELQKSKEQYARSGDINDMFVFLEKQNALENAYKE